MSAWTGFAIVVPVIVLIWLTLRVHAEAAAPSRQGSSPDGGTPENIHYFPSGNDLFGAQRRSFGSPPFGPFGWKSRLGRR